ncbi:MAG: hypothetical protein LBC10_05495 [Deltaproteobacteria bacterium]|jgi:hypothetical protein|nr:hypothetical protein [Deltaproteobacteria bacterium]
MLQRHESHSFLPAPFGLALCGLIFCAWNVWNADSVPCISAGCALFRNFTLVGISLWWPGIFGFAVLALCALSGRLRLGKFCAALGLILDCLLLILMLGTSPCLTCLFAALLLALAYLCFLLAAHTRQRTFTGLRFSILLAVWACLFVANLGGLARENAGPWAMQTPANAQAPVARAYFSPSCPACRQLVRELPPDQAAKLAWYPVAEKGHDLRVIAAMLERLRQGDAMDQALSAALEAPLTGQWTLLPDMLLLQLRLWRNQTHVIESGNTLPLLEFPGVPAFLLQPRSAAAPLPAPNTMPQTADQDPALPPELNIIERCGPQADTPCP